MFLKDLSKKTFVNLYISGFFQLLNSAASFVLLPVLTRHLTPEAYGIISIYQVIIFVLTILISLNLHNIISVDFFHLDKPRLASIVTNILLTTLVLGIIWFIILLLGGDYLSRLVNIPKKWLLLSILIVNFTIIFKVDQILWRMEQKMFFYGFVTFINFISNLFISIILIVFCKWSWEGRFLGILASAVISCLLSLYLLAKRNYLKINLSNYSQDIRTSLNFGLPLIPHTLGGMLINVADKALLNTLMGAYAVGIYSVGYQIGSVIFLVNDAVNQVWVPTIYKKLKNIDSAQKIKLVKLNYFYFSVLLSLAFLLSYLSPFYTPFLLGKNFRNSQDYIFWIALGFAFNGMYSRVADYIFFQKKTYLLAWVTLFTAILNIILNFVLIKLNGIIGAAQATAISFFLSFLLSWLLSQRVYPLPWLFFLKK